MSVRATTRTLTGRTQWGSTEIVLGFRESGKPGVTVHLHYDARHSYTDPAKIRELIEDLEVAFYHLGGVR